jgi:hypothetical protein
MAVKRALLAVYTDGHFTEQLRVARLLRQTAAYSPTFYFAQVYPQIDRDIETCRSESMSYVDGCPGRDDTNAGAGPGLSGSHGPVSWALHLMKDVLWRLPFPFTLVRALVRQWQQLRTARRVVAAHAPDILVLSEDSVGHETAALIASGRRQGIPSVIVPFTVANALEPAEAYYRDARFIVRSWSSRLAARLYPRWVYEHRGRRLLRLPAPQLIAKEWWGLAPPLPWIVNSGSATALAVESEFMEQYYLREGLPAGRMVRTGALYDDVLAEHQRAAPAGRAELCRELGLPADRPLILCALPPDQFILSGPQTDFSDYASMVQFWMQALAAVRGWNVVVRLHPRMDYDAHRDIERFGVRLSRRDTASLVPLCDLYVASVSATIRWAIACGKPALNYDAYRLRWTDYDDAPGVVRVEDKDAFTAVLQRFGTDAAFYEQVRASQEADAVRWGRLDGQAGARLLQLFDTLISQKAA